MPSGKPDLSMAQRPDGPAVSAPLTFPPHATVFKMDVLSYLDKIPVCTRYLVEGQQTDHFPFPTLLDAAKPVIEYMEGWKCDISGVRRWEDLPEAAQKYVEYIEEQIGCHIGFVSVGPERDSIIIR